MGDWIEGKARRLDAPVTPQLRQTLIERFIHSDLRIRLVWVLRVAAFGLLAYWQPGIAAGFLLGLLGGYNVGFKDARKGWVNYDGTPFT